MLQPLFVQLRRACDAAARCSSKRPNHVNRLRLSCEDLECRRLLDAGLFGEYFNETNLTSLADTRVDPVVNFSQDWGSAPPGTLVTPDDNYSDRWTGFVEIDKPGGGSGIVSGELKKWHKVSVTFDGPQTSETATPNPFTDYRLNVTFTHVNSGLSYLVPGFFAADGNAANTSASSGSKWRVHFAPTQAGEWRWSASFRSGTNVAVNDSANAGSPAGFFDGSTGTFLVSGTDKSGPDLRGKGLLEYVDGHYLRFAESGEYFLKQGPDAPENLLAYDDFDNTPDYGGRRRDYAPHAAGLESWRPLLGRRQGHGAHRCGQLSCLRRRQLLLVHPR